MIYYSRTIKLIVIFFLLIKSTCSFAITFEFYCPTVEEIRNGDYSIWLPIYLENSELALDADVKKFKEHVKGFLGARWDASYLEAAHCFYIGDDPILQKIVFAIDAWGPTQDSHWNRLSKTSAECITTLPKYCGFIS